jgi:hypothetical protein
MNKAIVLLAIVTLGLASVLSAKTVSEEIKTEVNKHMVYPTIAQEQMIEGEVWIKVAMDENKTVRIVEISSTNAALREIVKKQVAHISIENTGLKEGDVYIMKYKYDLLN